MVKASRLSSYLNASCKTLPRGCAVPTTALVENFQRLARFRPKNSRFSCISVEYLSAAISRNRLGLGTRNLVWRLILSISPGHFFSFSKFLIFYAENGFLNTGVFPSRGMKPLLSLKDVTWYISWLSKCLLVTCPQILWSAHLTNTGSSFQFFQNT